MCNFDLEKNLKPRTIPYTVYVLGHMNMDSTLTLLTTQKPFI